MQTKKSIQRYPISMTDAGYDYILDEIERREKMILSGMWVLIVKYYMYFFIIELSNINM